MKEIKMKKITKCTLLFFVLFYSTMNYGQAHYFSKYNGIPIIAHTNLSAEELTNKDSSLSRMRELGIYGFYATDIDTQMYNKIKSFGLKVFPYQLGWYSGVTNNEVVKYTDAVYTIWQAEGSGDGELGEAKIEFNSVIGEISQDGKSVISSVPSSSGTLIFGPYYYQSVYYKIIQNNPKTPVNYRAVFTLKIDRYIPESLPPGYENSEVCILRITAYNPYSQTETDVVPPLVLRVTDFEGWGNWKDFTFVDYNLGSLKNLTELELRMPSQTENLNEYTSEFMQYKVEFNGLPFLRLSVDSIFISDQRGRDLFNSIQTRQDIKLTVSQFSDEEYVLGWHGLGEPNSIDNYLPFREMNNLIKEVNPELRVFTSLTSGPWGRYTWHEFYGGVNNPEICPGYEFYKKTGLDYISINLYNYHYPFIPPYPFPSVSGFPVDANYIGKNINYVTDSTLRKYNNFSETIPFSYSSQSGRFYDYDTLTCYNKMGNHINPSFRQFNYHINLGLMFGAREITLDPVFSQIK